MKTLILIFVLLITTCLFSTIINVPGDQPTIQEGIEAAADTDTVLVADGTYFENIDFIGKAITVASNFLIDADTLHIANTIINGSQPTNPDFGSCVRFMSNEDSTSKIIGFTLTEGTGTADPVHYGGGIYCIGSSPKIVSNIITNNSALCGGGVDCSFNSNAIILDNVISYNTASENMGGITLYANSNAHVEGNIISNNTANNHCGGMLISESSPKLIDNIIRENSALTGYSGGAHIESGSSPVFLDNIICNNTAGTYAGGLHITLDSTPSIQNCHIYGNNASSSGGGIRIWYANLDIINCIISDNHSDTYGSGIHVYYGEIDVINCTISDNHANLFGGGICYTSDLNSSLVNCILWNNLPQEIYIASSGSVTATYSDIQGGWAGTGNIDEDPLFVGTGDNPYSLLEDSPSIDTGIPDTTGTGLNLPPWDIIGNIRIWDGDGNGSAIIDMGAYEYGSPPYVDADFEATPTTGTAPLTVQFTDLSAGNPIYWEWDFNNDETIDSNEQNPEWIYEEAGTYSVSLTIGDEINQSTEIKIDYIVVNPVSAQGDIVILTTKLFGNYPNPFNPTTTINYSLKENSKVSLNIYNIKGQKVKQLVSDQLPAGQHSVIWNGKDDNDKTVSSGMYLYKLKIGNYEKTKKMILMK